MNNANLTQRSCNCVSVNVCQVCGEAAVPVAEVPRSVSQHVSRDPAVPGRRPTCLVPAAQRQKLPRHAQTEVRIYTMYVYIHVYLVYMFTSVLRDSQLPRMY